jgi:hypothetical protein
VTGGFAFVPNRAGMRVGIGWLSDWPQPDKQSIARYRRSNHFGKFAHGLNVGYPTLKSSKT